jgi:tol-pal system protein YbgF
MARLELSTVLVAFLLVGCAGLKQQSRAPEWQPAIDELVGAQARLELRVEELTRNLMAIRARLDAQETLVEELSQARAAPAPPPLKVVKLEPPPQSAKLPEVVPAPTQELPSTGLYSKAFNAYREQRYGQAILDFEEFLRAYPDHAHADNARYWIGESFYSQGEYEQAVVEFSRVFERYPDEDKAPDALLKVGYAYKKLGDLNNAKVFWRRVKTRYPESEAARKAKESLSETP